VNPIAKRWLAALIFFGAALAWQINGVAGDTPTASCVDDGNRVCQPDNPEGEPAGCYDDGGVLWADWPCEAWKPSDGYVHADGTITH
jgi:hypothetical protein